MNRENKKKKQCICSYEFICAEKNSLDACGKLHFSYFIRLRANISSVWKILCGKSQTFIQNGTQATNNNKTFILKTSMAEKHQAIWLETSTMLQSSSVFVCMTHKHIKVNTYATRSLYDGMQTDRKIYARCCAPCMMLFALSIFMSRTTISHIWPCNVHTKLHTDYTILIIIIIIKNSVKHSLELE